MRLNAYHFVYKMSSTSIIKIIIVVNDAIVAVEIQK